MPSTLDITNGSLTYTASAGIQNNLTISVANGKYVFSDTGETINLFMNNLPGAPAGWSGSGTNMVMGPTASVTNDFVVDLKDQADALKVDDPISVGGTVKLLSGGSIGTPNNGSITAANLALSAASGIGILGTPISTTVSGLVAQNTSSGGIFISNTGTLTIGFAGDPFQGVRDTGASTDAVVLTNAGTLNVTRNSVKNEIISAPASVTVTTTGNSSDLVTGESKNLVGVGADTSLWGSIVSGNGPMSLTAGRNLVLGTKVSGATAEGDVTAGTTLTLSAGGDIVIDAASIVSSSGQVTGTAGGNIALLHQIAGQASIQSNGGAILLATGQGGTFTADSGADQDLESTGGDITVVADNVVLNDPTSIDATTGAGGTDTVTLTTATPGRTIFLGQQTAGDLSLTDSDLSTILADGLLRIGSNGTLPGGTVPANTGGIIVNNGALGAIGSSSAGNWNNTLSLVTTGSITGGGQIQVTNLALRAGGSGLAVFLGNTTNAVANLAAAVSAGGFTFVNNGALVIGGPIDGVSGITDTSNQAVTVITADGDITVQANIASSGGSIRLQTTIVTKSHTLTNQAAITTSGGATIFLRADAEDLQAGSSISSPGGTVQFSANAVGVNLGLGSSAAGLNFSQAELNTISTSTLSFRPSQDVDLDAPVNFAGIAPTVAIQAFFGAIVDNNATEPDLTATNLALLASSGITADTAAAILAFQNTSGAVVIHNSGGLTIGSVDSLDTSFNTGTTTSVSASSPVTIAVNTTSAGTLTYTATETSPPAAGDDITVNAGVTVKSTGGDVVLQAGDQIILNTGSVVKSDVGTVSLTTGFNDNDNVGGATIQGSIQGTAPTLTGSGTASTINTFLIDFANGAALPNGLTVTGGPSGKDTLTVSDAGDAVAHTFTVTSSTAVRDGTTIHYSSLGTLNVNGGSGGDTYNVQGTSAATNITGGTGNDTVNVSSDAPTNNGTLDAIAGTLSLDVGAGTNAVTISDFGQTTTANSNVVVTSSQITGFAGATNATTINYAATGGTATNTLALRGASTLANTFNVQATNSLFATTITGGGQNDTVNVGSATNSLAGIAGALSIVGGANQATTTTGAAGTTVATAVVIGDTVNFKDQGDAGNITYALDSTSLGRTGAATVTFSGVETLTASTSTGTDTLTVSAVPTGVDHLVLTGNSLAGSADTINIQATAAGTVTEANGGAGNDIFNLGSSANSLATILGVIAVNGGANTATTTTAAAGTQVARSVTVGDTLNFNDQGDTGNITYGVGASTFTRTSAANVAFKLAETLVVNTSTGNDTLTQSAVPGGVNHTVYNGNSQGGATPTVDTFTIQATAANTATEVTGGAGNDAFMVASSVNDLGTIAGVLSFSGGGNLATTTTAAAGTQVATAVTVGDSLSISDFGFSGGASYGIGANLVSTGGVGGMAYRGVETLTLSTSKGNDTVNVGTATLPTGNGTGANPTGGAPTAGHVIVNGNSTAASKDTINVRATAAGSATEINTGAGNDIINLGTDPTTSANSLGGLAGVVSINAGANLATTTTANAGTPVAAAVVIGDTVNVNDQGDAGNYSYGIGTSLLTRSGVAGVAYGGTETLAVNSSTGNDTFFIGTATLPAATPATVSATGGAPGVDHLLVTGNSAAGTVDTFDLDATAAGTATELVGGAGSDVFNVTASAGLGTGINGGAPVVAPGDTINYDAVNQTLTFAPNTVQPGTGQTTYYTNLETFGSVTNPAGPVKFIGDSTNNRLTVDATGTGSGAFQLDAGLRIPLSGITVIAFDGGAGNDTLVVNNPAGGLFAPSGGISFAGGTGSDALEDLGGQSDRGSHTPTGSDGTGFSGILTHTSGGTTQTIGYSGLSPLTDLVAEATFTVNGTAAGEDVNIVNGPVVFGTQTTEVNSGASGTFETLDLAQKTTLQVDSLAGVDTFTINNPTPAVGLTTVSVDTGDGNDVVHVIATPAGVSTRLNSATGGPDPHEVVTIGNGSIVQSILGPVDVQNDVPGGGLTDLTLDDSADTTARTVSVSNSAITGLAPAVITYDFNDVGSLTIDGGSGGNSFTVSSTLPGTPGTTTINGGSGDDTFAITAAGLGDKSINDFNGQGGNDTFTVTGAPPASVTFNIDGGSNTGAPGDTLAVVGYSATTLTNTFLPDSSGHVGNITIDGGLIHYAGLEPVALGGSAVNLVINLPTGDGDNQAVLEDNGTAGDGISQIRSANGTFETTTFVNPTGSLTLNTGDDGETVTVATLDSGFAAPIALNGGAGSDTFNITPNANASISVTGAAPTPPALPGDTLNVDTTGTTNPFLTVTPQADGDTGSYTFGNRQTVSFRQVETLSPSTVDLSITKTDNQTTATPGNQVTYTITASNSGSIGIAGVTVTDSFPSTLSNIQWTASFSTGSTGTASGSGDLSQTVNLAAGGSVTYTVTATIASSATGLLTNTATVAAPTGVTDTNPSNNSAADTDALVPSTDLAVTKAGPATVTAGTNLTYTLTLINNGPSDAVAVQLTDDVPAGTTFVAVNQTSGPTFTPAVGGGTVTETAALLAPGQSAIFVLVVHADASDPKGSTITNTAVVGAATGDSKPANNSDSVTTTVDTAADLAVTKVGPATVTAGTNVTYTLSVADNGPSDAQSVSLTDVLPANTTLVSATQTGGPTFAISGTTTVSATIATLAAGQSGTFVVVVHLSSAAPEGSSLANTETAASTTTDTNGSNNSETRTAAVVAVADLAVTKTGPATVTAGTSVTYTITLTNNGPSDAQSVNLTDDVPANTTFASETQTAGPTFTASTPAVGASGTVSDTIATLAAGQSATFVLVVNVASAAADGSSISNTAAVTSTTTDNTPANNSAAATAGVVARADLAVTKTGPATVTAGTDLTYTISLVNNGPSDALSVSLTDDIPTHTTFVSETQTSGPHFDTTTPPAGGTGTFTANASSLVAGQSATFVFIVHVGADTPAATVVSNTAAATTTTTDTNSANDSSTVNTTVATAANLVLTKTGLTASVEGQNVTYTLTVINNGPSDAQAVVITDTLPADAAFVSTTFPAGSTTATDTTITTNLGTVAAGATVTGTYVITLKEEGSKTDTAVVSSSTSEISSGDNTATATTNVTDASLTSTGKSITPTEGTSFTGTVATFTDLNTFAPTSDFTVSINWGDGSATSTGTVSGSAGSFTVTGTHTYTEDGPFTVSVAISDKGGSSTQATTTATVSAVPIEVTGVAVAGNERTPLDNVLTATFTHANGLEPVSGFSATIDWGDGTMSAGTVTLNGTTYEVRGSHTYGDEQTYTVETTVVDGSATASANSKATILEELLFDGTRGTANQRYINELYRDLLGRPADGSGLQVWVGLLQQGATRQQVAADIVNSNEYRARVVDSLYQTFLHRHADAVGLNLGTQFLALGRSTQDLAAVIAASPEYFQNRGGGTNDGFLDAAYQDVFSRPVDPGARTTYDGALKAGFSRQDVLSALFSSDEYRHDLLDALYRRFLDRDGDPVGEPLAFQGLRQGMQEAQVVIALAGSDEFFNKTAP